MNTDPKSLEDQAYLALSEQKFEEAFRLYHRAAVLYKEKANHKQAALMFASAASCWALKSGEKAFYNSAKAYEEAAEQAEKSKDLEYASLLYRYAAINYEKDMEFISFSDCFFRSRESLRKFLAMSLLFPKRLHRIVRHKEETGFLGVSKRFFLWLALATSNLIWGHGERPARTLFCGIFLILLSAFFYSRGHLLENGVIFKPDLFESLYFSVITFTTVGYGDFSPCGLSKLVVMIEVFCGIFIIPLFVVGLSRKYLRL